ncbi:fibronectin type III domain-containing protein [Paenibacillus oenotherae]|uniref:Fibronectin type III domain-containing protein n=2 Tax=Paenibacillus oenotherae TaxID=1435645 RepID=A0ABS7D3U4_9BACL|nr:fibronectin type III domain-containing protein [Paenibacillus oenotherae]
MKFLSENGSGGDTQAPSAPANLASTGKTNTTVSLSWTASTDNVGVTGYDVFRNGTKVGTSTTTSYTDTGLTAETSYKYTVKAFDAASNVSAASNEVTVVTSAGPDLNPPTAPTGLASTGKTATTVSLSWTASTDNVGVTGYDILRNGVKVGTSTTTSYTDTGLTAETSYKYTVKAYDGEGNRSAASNEVTVVTSPGTDTQAPTVPAGLASTGKTATTVSLSWTASTDNVGVTGYEVLRNNTVVGTTATTSYTDTGLTAATAYSYTVLAKDAAGNKSAPSAALQVTTEGGSGNVAEVYYYTKTRNWSAVNIHYRPTGGTWTTAPGVPMNETGCTDWTKKTINLGTATGMNADFNNGSSWDNNNGADYNLGFGIVTVKDGVVTNNAVSPCVPLPEDLTAPSVPQNLQATATNVSITVTWTASTDNAGGRGVAGYEVTRTGGSQGTKVFTTTNNFYSDSRLDAQTTYTYTVKAYDKAVPVNTSASSAPVSAKTGDAPQQPVGGTPLGTDMREDSIYFVMTARFYDGDSSNNRGGVKHVTSGNAANNDPMFRGDFKGLIEKLDYIKALGFSAIWITPVVLNRSDYDFHGYHGYDFFRVDPRLESPGATYQDLINAAHNKGIKIIQDVVYNHSSRWGAKGLFTPKVFGIRDSQWSTTYDEPIPGLEYDGLTENAAGKPYNGDLWSTEEPAGNTCRNWGIQQGTNPEGKKVYNCQWPNATSGMFPTQFYHPCWIGNWEGEDSRSCWIHEDLADFNTESKVVQDYLKEAYRRFIDMGVDSFRIDTAVHVPRVTWNRHFLPDAMNYSVEKFGEKGKNFFMFGEVGAFVHDKWNRGSVNHSAQFFTWKERKEYSANDEVAALEQYNYENNMGISNQPTSTNAFLNGNNYHAPDHSKFSGMSVIDMRMHMNFGEANNAFHNGKDSDDSYNDATYNVVYVDSHDYGPNKSKNRFAGGTAAWAENMSLMWTFRGIPTLYYGSEIEFKAGAEIDCGPTCPLETTGRAYFGGKIEGNVTASEFGKADSASGAVATTLNNPLVKHVQRLNQIRRKIPALQKGQYSTENISGNMSFKRRYTDAAKGIDSFALVTISGSATFNNIPSGVYKDAITGDVKNVTNGTLTASVSGKGNMRVYVLDLPGNPAPGKIGVDGEFLK